MKQLRHQKKKKKGSNLQKLKIFNMAKPASLVLVIQIAVPKIGAIDLQT